MTEQFLRTIEIGNKFVYEAHSVVRIISAESEIESRIPYVLIPHNYHLFDPTCGHFSKFNTKSMGTVLN